MNAGDEFQPLDAGVTNPARVDSIPWPATIACALALATLDVVSWTSHGPPYRYVVATSLIVLSFAIDGALSGSRRRLKPLAALSLVFFSLWIAGVHTFALMSGNWEPDGLVILAGALPLAAAPAAYFALPARPKWGSLTSKALQIATLIFGVTALLDAALTPWGEQPTLLGHEKAFLAIVVMGMPKTRRSAVYKAITLTALIVAFIKYPSATVGFVVIVSMVCFWLLQAKTNTSRNIRTIGLIGCFGVIAVKSNDWIAKFYAVMGRGDNTETRLGLWDQAIASVVANPVVGSAASEPITGLANIRGVIQPVPFHNSFLTLAVSCGLVAVGLLALSTILLFATCLSPDLGMRRRAGLWLPALLGGLVTMSVNPVLDSLGTALPFYALMLCGSTGTPRTSENSERYHAR
ncbi:hypothetical protein [Pseudarthrobacter sp. H2]|uniref:hypothetical protein n=1 Tax=Pseudarthrobacter sp. H2 TaxID=3418415 RepID=UPI003CF3AC1F